MLRKTLFLSLSLSLPRRLVSLIADQPPRALRRSCWIPVIRVNGLPSARRRSGLVCGVGVRWTEEQEENTENTRTLRVRM